MRTLVIVVAALAVTAAYMALVCLLGAVLNMHGNQPRKNERK